MAEDEKDQAERAEPVDFKEVVAALLKVDPKGIVGKDRKRGTDTTEDAGK